MPVEENLSLETNTGPHLFQGFLMTQLHFIELVIRPKKGKNTLLLLVISAAKLRILITSLLYNTIRPIVTGLSDFFFCMVMDFF